MVERGQLFHGQTRTLILASSQSVTRMKLIANGNPVKGVGGAPRIRWAVCLIVLCLCCATGAAPQDQAILYFFNTSGWKAIPEKLTLLDNDKKVAALNREHYVALPIAPGHHVFHLKYEKPTKKSPLHEVDLDAQPGVTYYVAGGYTPNGYAFRWTLKEISKDQADQFLAKMKPQAQK